MKFTRQAIEQLLQRHVAPMHSDRTGIELRQIEQLVEQRFERDDRIADPRNQVARFLRARVLIQRGRKKPKRVQRLTQVVTGSGKKL